MDDGALHYSRMLSSCFPFVMAAVPFFYANGHAAYQAASVTVPPSWAGRRPKTFTLLTVDGTSKRVLARIPLQVGGSTQGQEIIVRMQFQRDTSAMLLVPAHWLAYGTRGRWESDPAGAIVLTTLGGEPFAPGTLPLPSKEEEYGLAMRVGGLRQGILELVLPLPDAGMMGLLRALEEQIGEATALPWLQVGELRILPAAVVDPVGVGDDWGPPWKAEDLVARIEALIPTLEPADDDDVSVVGQAARAERREQQDAMVIEEEEESSVEEPRSEVAALEETPELSGYRKQVDDLLGVESRWMCPVTRELLLRDLQAMQRTKQQPPTRTEPIVEVSEENCPIAHRGPGKERNSMPLFPELYTFALDRERRRNLLLRIQLTVHAVGEPWHMGDSTDDLPAFTTAMLIAEALYALFAHARFEELRLLGEVVLPLYNVFVFTVVHLDPVREGMKSDEEPRILLRGRIPRGTFQDPLAAEVDRYRTAMTQLRAVLDSGRLRVVPRTYQRLAALWMLVRRYGFLAMHQGLGKTITVLLYTLATGEGVTVVMAQGGIAKQWIEEWEKHRLRTTLLRGDTQTKAIDMNQADLVAATSNYVLSPKSNAGDAGRALHAQLSTLPNVKRIIIDEAHLEIPKDTKEIILPQQKNAARFLLSGTPFLNTLLGTEALRYYVYGFQDPAGAHAKINRADFFYVEYDGVTLPPIRPGRIHDIEFDFATPEEGALYHAFSVEIGATNKRTFDLPSYKLLLSPAFLVKEDWRQLQEKASGATGKEYWPLITRQHLAGVLDVKYDWGRLTALRQVIVDRVADPLFLPIEEKGRSVPIPRRAILVFSTRVNLLSADKGATWPLLLSERLGIPHRMFVYTTDKSTRGSRDVIVGKKALDAWKEAARAPAGDSRPVLMFGTYALMGAGLNLQEADTVILLDEPWQPAERDQAGARALRTGQTPGRVHIIGLLARGTEEVLQRRARSGIKRDLASRFAVSGEIAETGAEEQVAAFSKKDRRRLWDEYKSRPAIKEALELAEKEYNPTNLQFITA